MRPSLPPTPTPFCEPLKWPLCWAPIYPIYIHFCHFARPPKDPYSSSNWGKLLCSLLLWPNLLGQITRQTREERTRIAYAILLSHNNSCSFDTLELALGNELSISGQVFLPLHSPAELHKGSHCNKQNGHGLSMTQVLDIANVFFLTTFTRSRTSFP